METVTAIVIKREGKILYFRINKIGWWTTTFPNIEDAEVGDKIEFKLLSGWDRLPEYCDYEIIPQPYGPMKGARLIKK